MQTGSMNVSGSISVTQSGSLRLPVGSAAATLKALDEKDASDKKILRAVTKLFKDAEVKPLEDGRRVFISTGVRGVKHTLRFLLTEQGKIYLRKVALVKVSGVDDHIEVWSHESFAVDKNNMLAILNESASKLKGDKLTPAFSAVLD